MLLSRVIKKKSRQYRAAQQARIYTLSFTAVKIMKIKQIMKPN